MNRWGAIVNLLLRRAGAAAAGAVLVLGSGCASREYFSRSVRAKHDLSPEEVVSLQFFTDTPVVLRRISDAESKRARGTLRIEAERRVDDVEIDEQTPGVAESVGEGWVAVSFEPGAYLYFLELPRTKSAEGYYALGAFKRARRYYATYGGENRRVLGSPRLMYDAELLRRLIHERRKVKGRTLGD